MIITQDILEMWCTEIDNKCFGGRMAVGIGSELRIKQTSHIKAAGCYRAPRETRDYHLILLNPKVHDNTFQYKMTLVHEIVHLIQAKNGVFTINPHDALFKALCKHCAKQLNVDYKEII